VVPSSSAAADLRRAAGLVRIVQSQAVVLSSPAAVTESAGEAVHWPQQLAAQLHRLHHQEHQ
jgi:hypothetical protein